MAKRQRFEQSTSLFQASAEVCCPLCARPVPKSQADKHHLVPVLKGGKETVVLHRICHRQVHALFTEAQLARDYNTVDLLLQHPEVQAFVRWVSKKPPDFYAPVRRSNQRNR